MSAACCWIALPTMITTLLLIAVTTIWPRATTGSLVASTVTRTEIDCENGTWSHYREAAYDVWRFVSIRLPYRGSCLLNLTFEALSARRQPDLLLLHLLVKVTLPPLLFYDRNVYVQTSEGNAGLMNDGYLKYRNPSSTAYYIRSRESVWLKVNFYVDSFRLARTDVEAAFVVTEATNVCNSRSGAGEQLMVASRSNNSSHYVFAPDARNVLLSSNNVPCRTCSAYSLTIRPRVAFSFLAVTMLACPLNDSCGLLLLNGLSCREGETMQAPHQPGWSVTLHYMLLGNCSKDYEKFAGFSVSAQVSDTVVQAQGEQQVLDSGTHVVATAIVGTILVAAFAICLVVALRARWQLRRALSQLPPPKPGASASAVTVRCGGKSPESDDAYEPLGTAASDQHVYEVVVPGSV